MATAEISASEVFKLRKQTGAGMMDCKKALMESNGDFDAAIDYLRKKGQKLADKRADRDATEGYAYAATKGNKAYISVLNCETDFVAKNEDFAKLTQSIAQVGIDNDVADLEALLSASMGDVTVKEKVVEQTGVVGEKLDLSFFAKVEGEKVYAYNHPGNQVVAIVAFNKECADDVAKDVAMQIAAMAPVSLNKEDCPQDVIEKELEIAKEQLKQEGKPEEMIEKIAQGKLGKFFKENTLLGQAFIKDGKKSVDQYLKEQDKDLTVVAFKRFAMS